MALVLYDVLYLEMTHISHERRQNAYEMFVRSNLMFKDDRHVNCFVAILLKT